MEHGIRRAIQTAVPQKSDETLWRFSGHCMGVDDAGASTHLPLQVALIEGLHMNGETVLLRVVDGPWEGWRVMAFDEFLQSVSIDSWNASQALVGMVLPAQRGKTH
jgi:hypothetical protein